MRFGDAHGVVPMAEALRSALEARGVEKNHIVNMRAGGDIDAEVFSKIEASGIFLVFGSAKYGEVGTCFVFGTASTDDPRSATCRTPATRRALSTRASMRTSTRRRS
jgi:hypothetical protein